MKLEVGKFYLTRDGRKVGPLNRAGRGFNDNDSGPNFMWYDDGFCFISKVPHNDDLIAPWPPEQGTLAEIGANVGDVVEWRKGESQSPVRTVTTTRTEIVPGVYGPLSVHSLTTAEKGLVWVALLGHGAAKDETLHARMSASDLTEAINTLTQILHALTDA